jgi:hypothetical protein
VDLVLLAEIAGVVLVGIVTGLTLRSRRDLSRARERLESRLEMLAGERPSLGGRLPPPWLDQPAPPDALVHAVVSGECVLFAGAGVGAAAGLPTWGEFLRRAVAYVGDQLPDEVLTQARGDLADGAYERVVEIIATQMSSDQRRAVLADAMNQPASRRSSLASALRGLPFAGAITDLWVADPLRNVLAGDPVVFGPNDVRDVSSVLRRKQRFIVQAYGDLASGELIFRGREFEERLRGDPVFFRFLQTVTATNSLLFVGASFDGIEEFLHAAVQASPERPHFALVPWQADGDVRAMLLERRYGVQVLFYTASRDHAEVREFVLRLREEVSNQRPPQRATVREQAATVDRVELRGIGPFDALDIPLHPRMTVLLGDNGSGKSSVLRSIALALSGEGPETQRAAARTLRVGADRGSISLWIGTDRYSTTLVRDEARIRLTSERISPIESGLWLGLGFPPLRGASLTEIAGPVATPSRNPSPDDLLPLAGDMVDERLDDLRQWIVNTALLSEESTRAGKRADQMLARFFAILYAFTPQFEMRYHGIDRRTWEVIMDTPDGRIPLSNLSRGITAILGWVGVLLQRVYDVYDDTDSPEEQRGLLLVDEVDVHLHPGWQRLMLPLLLDNFPGLQIVATTHSPLAIGAVEDAQLIHLRRVGGAIVAELLESQYEGWRADQILTSRAFDLETSRDPKTEKRMLEYGRMRADPRTKKNVDTVRLAHELAEGLPGPQETEDERLVAGLVREALDERLDNMPIEQKRVLIDQADRYLARLRKGESA